MRSGGPRCVWPTCVLFGTRVLPIHSTTCACSTSTGIRYINNYLIYTCQYNLLSFNTAATAHCDIRHYVTGPIMWHIMWPGLLHTRGLIRGSTEYEIHITIKYWYWNREPYEFVLYGNDICTYNRKTNYRIVQSKHNVSHFAIVS